MERKRHEVSLRIDRPDRAADIFVVDFEQMTAMRKSEDGIAVRIRPPESMTNWWRHLDDPEYF